MKKVLFVIADAASGHRSGALAMESAFAEEFPGKFETKTIDIFKLADIQPFNALDETMSLVSQNRWMERAEDFGFRISTAFKVLFTIFYRYMMWRMLDEAKKIIDSEDPDLVISVHPFASMLLRGIKEKYPNIKYKTGTVVTDLSTLYRGWGHVNADLVTVGTAKGANLLMKFGVPMEKVMYPVFPIKPEMKHHRTKEQVMKELGFSDRKHTIMITGGGFGLKRMLRVVQDLVKDTELQLIVITGRVEFLRQQLEMRFKNFERVKVFGFVTNIQDYLYAADVVVTKPGPATVLEAEVYNKKVVLTRKVGHQESGNIDYALTNPNFRFVGEDLHKLKPAIYSLLHEKASDESPRRVSNESAQIVRKFAELLVQD